MAKTKQARALDAKLAEAKAKLKAMDRERRKRVANFAHWNYQGVLQCALTAGFDQRELDAIAYRAAEICHYIEAGFPRVAGEASHG